VRSLLTILALTGALAACTGGGSASFDPNSPCTADVKQPGAYPALEKLIPTQFEGRDPNRLDSGRNCTPQSLGALATAGVRELHFAGGLWEVGQRSGVTLAVLSAPSLTADATADFYVAGARAGRNTENVTRSRVELQGMTGWQVATLNDESFQTVIVWPAPQPDTVRVVLVGSDVRETNGIAEHSDRVAQAEAAFSGL
jgi:hypothetical protein